MKAKILLVLVIFGLTVFQPSSFGQGLGAMYNSTQQKKQTSETGVQTQQNEQQTQNATTGKDETVKSDDGTGDSGFVASAWERIKKFWWVIVLVLVLIFHRLFFRLFGIIIIPEKQSGLVIKQWKIMGANKTLEKGRLIATKGEAGIQANLLPPGFHWGYWPWQYSIDKIDVIIIPEGHIGIIEAIDGATPEKGVILSKTIDSDNFQDATKFLENGGLKGIQRKYLQPGNYRINTSLFNVEKVKFTNIPEGKIGIVTTLDGQALPHSHIAGQIIPDHSSFQDVDAFLSKGGTRGLQEQVLKPGDWMIHNKFASVELVEFTTIPVGSVGVVISYVGEEGTDVSGENFTHGNIVKEGQKGVWQKVLDPGKYAINTKVMRVETVLTTNIVLNWADSKSEAHKLDENLSTITLRSKDGFKFNADVSQIINIDYKEAPKVIARFGTVKNLISQVLEPTIGNYFRNSAQEKTVLDFLDKRKEAQDSAKSHIGTVLKDYNVVAVDTLIGDLVPPEELMEQLRGKKVAEAEKEKF